MNYNKITDYKIFLQGCMSKNAGIAAKTHTDNTLGETFCQLQNKFLLQFVIEKIKRRKKLKFCQIKSVSCFRTNTL